MTKLTYEFLKKEICKRDDAKGTGYDLRANHVSACMSHFEDIVAENLIDCEDGKDVGTPFLIQFKDRIIKKTRRIREARARKSKRPDKSSYAEASGDEKGR